MKHGKLTRGMPVVLFGGLVAAGVVLAPSAAADLHLVQYVEVPQCTPATGQECPQAPQVNYGVGRNEPVAVQFTANANGCSDAYIKFLADGYPVSDWLRVSPDQTVYSDKFVKGAGSHVLSVMAKGIEGRCNTGILNAWGGTVVIDSRAEEPPADEPSAYDALPPCLPWIKAPNCQIR